jgi:hypothetical protein
MCQGGEHRYNVKVTITLYGEPSFERKVNVLAKGTAQAIAKADYWATENFPGAQWVEFTCHHSGYSTLESAVEHGAINPLSHDYGKPDPRPTLWWIC